MNKVLKRTVATLLTAGMLLAGLTACDETPGGKDGIFEGNNNSLTELANKESDIKFDEIIHINVSGRNSITKT